MGKQQKNRWLTLVGLTMAIAVFAAACSGQPGEAGTQEPGPSAQSAPTGITLEKERQTITSALRVDLTRDFATLPLHRGMANGVTVW